MIGYRVYRNISLLATGIAIKGAPGKVGGYDIHNNAATARFVRFYDSAAAPTVGTTAPVMTIQVAAGGHVVLSPGSIAEGIAFASGIGIGATNLVADNDTTAPSANDVVVNVFYL